MFTSRLENIDTSSIPAMWKNSTSTSSLDLGRLLASWSTQSTLVSLPFSISQSNSFSSLDTFTTPLFPKNRKPRTNEIIGLYVDVGLSSKRSLGEKSALVTIPTGPRLKRMPKESLFIPRWTRNITALDDTANVALEGLQGSALVSEESLDGKAAVFQSEKRKSHLDKSGKQEPVKDQRSSIGSEALVFEREFTIQSGDNSARRVSLQVPSTTMNPEMVDLLVELQNINNFFAQDLQQAEARAPPTLTLSTSTSVLPISLDSLRTLALETVASSSSPARSDFGSNNSLFADSTENADILMPALHGSDTERKGQDTRDLNFADDWDFAHAFLKCYLPPIPPKSTQSLNSLLTESISTVGHLEIDSSSSESESFSRHDDGSPDSSGMTSTPTLINSSSPATKMSASSSLTSLASLEQHLHSQSKAIVAIKGLEGMDLEKDDMSSPFVLSPVAVSPINRGVRSILKGAKNVRFVDGEGSGEAFDMPLATLPTRMPLHPALQFSASYADIALVSSVVDKSTDSDDMIFESESRSASQRSQMRRSLKDTFEQVPIICSPIFVHPKAPPSANISRIHGRKENRTSSSAQSVLQKSRVRMPLRNLLERFKS